MTAIEFENVSKQYRLGLVSTGTIQHDINRWFQTTILRREDPYLRIGEVNDRTSKGTSEYVWALKDINFKVEQGDVVGIIGKNGAGKSTLLKLLSKVTAPTTGVIRARGRIASLLEVGTGFHGEMTGRENIYLNGAILGMTKQEINSKLDEIVDFSGCERYIDTPIKRYSSGMTVRLGFAVAAFLDPEILVVDEVLAVGDAEFQKKAIGKMKDVSQGEGRTVLFVSHNMASIKKLCNYGVLLDNGMIKYKGDIDETLNLYLQEQFEETDDIMDELCVLDKNVVVKNVLFNDSRKNTHHLSYDKNKLDITFEGELKQPMRLAIEGHLYDKNQILLGHFAPAHVNGFEAPLKEGNFSIIKTLQLPENMTQGSYFLDVSLTDPSIAYKVKFQHPIKIEFEAKAGNTGWVFNYNGNGLLILS